MQFKTINLCHRRKVNKNFCEKQNRLLEKHKITTQSELKFSQNVNKVCVHQFRRVAILVVLLRVFLKKKKLIVSPQ